MIATSRPIHAVVVAYDSPSELDDCLAALAGSIDATVVDNSSSADVRAVAERRGVEYADSGSNVGFAAGVNLALSQITPGPPRDILLLNPDAVLPVTALETLGSALHEPGNERVAALSPRIVHPGGDDQRVLWPFPSPGRAWAEAIGLGRLPARHTFAIGAVLLLRWEAVLDVGLFDERFFLYAEEADWQRRALARGWFSALCPEAVASHQGAGTSSDPLRRETLFHAAQEIYVRKWYGRLGWQVYRAAACLGAAGRAVVLGGDRRTEAARRAHLYFRGPKRCATPVRG